MDLSFLQILVGDKMYFAYRVSILVLMDLSFLQMTMNNLYPTLTGVSILVLMDLSFLHKMKTSYFARLNSGFNPCSYGSFVLTIYV